MLVDFFCTFATNGYIKELKILIKSLSLFNPNSKLVIFSDTILKNELEVFLKENVINLEIEIVIKLDKYTNKNRHIMEKEGIFKEFTIIKADLIEYTLNKYEYTVFLDSDILVVNPIVLPEENIKFDIGLCPHFIKPKFSARVGLYNSGFIFVRNRDFPEYWRNATKKSRYFEQASLENCARRFKTFNFGENFNVAWWKVELGMRPKQIAYTLLTSDNNNMYYNKNPIIFVHSHFNNKGNFNEKIKKLLKDCKEKCHLLKLINE